MDAMGGPQQREQNQKSKPTLGVTMMHHATKRGFKDCPGFLNSTGLGPRKRAEMLHHPCILGGPQQRGTKSELKTSVTGHHDAPRGPWYLKIWVSSTARRPNSCTARALRLRRPIQKECIPEMAFSRASCPGTDHTHTQTHSCNIQYSTIQTVGAHLEYLPELSSDPVAQTAAQSRTHTRAHRRTRTHTHTCTRTRFGRTWWGVVMGVSGCASEMTDVRRITIRASAEGDLDAGALASDLFSRLQGKGVGP